MLICQHTLDEIYKSLGSVDNESGGLIGSKSNEGILDSFYFDIGRRSSANKYVPNVDVLQQLLSYWDKEQIRFRGIIHSHTISDSLSPKDIKMARKILDMNMLSSVLMPIYLIKDQKILWYVVSIDCVKCVDFKTVNLGGSYEK